MSYFRILLSLLLLSQTQMIFAERYQLSGVIKNANQLAMAGVIVSLTDAKGASESVYSDQQGRWSIKSSELKPPVTLRIRASANYADVEQNLAEKTADFLSVVLQPLQNPAAVSEQLTASAHAAAINWQDADTRKDFVSQCHFCHQIGNALTRQPKTEEQWHTTIKRMQGYGALITWKNEDDFAVTLSENFAGAPVSNQQTSVVHDDLSKAKMLEWAFGGGINYVHDIEQGKDGLIYGVDMSADKVWILDRATNAIESVGLPPKDLPLGGDFAGAVAPLGTFAAYHGPHSIVEGPDGKMYLSCSLSAEICIFDPKTRQFEFIAVGGDAIYPHTLRFDAKGRLWFTLALSNQVGLMDIKTKEIQLIDLPSHGFIRWLSDAMLPTVLTVASWFGKEDMHIALSHHKVTGKGREILNLPYGLDISPIDGSVWYSKLYSGYIGRIDPESLAVEEMKTPHDAPRRLRFDQKGVLWIPSFEEGILMKFDTATKRFVKNYRLPLLAENEYETPYALAVHPQTQQVWIAANMSDRILRFDPLSEQFAAYPSPTRVTFLRDFIFTPEGDVCTSNANLPSSAIEGGRPKFMCLIPEAYK